MTGSLRKVVIVGAGLAGWAAAAALARSLRGLPVGISVVRSAAPAEDLPVEYTLPSTPGFLAGLGLDEMTLLRHAGGAHRLGTEFIDWPAAGRRSARWFGQHGANIGFIPFHHYAVRRRIAGRPLDFDACSANAVAARAGRFGQPAGATSLAARIEYGLCLDRAACSGMLRRIALNAGVSEAAGTLAGITRREDGGIASLLLSDDVSIDGDLFLDCSGHTASVIGAEMGVTVPDDPANLPFDRVLAAPAKQLPVLATRCTALDGAWLLDVPVAYGGCHLLFYAQEQTDDATATELLQAARNVGESAACATHPLTRGPREAAWRHNCVGIGAAAGMPVPLLASELHWIQEDIGRLLRLLPGEAAAARVAQQYNSQRLQSHANFRDYLLVLYAATESATATASRPEMPKSFRRRRTLFECSGRVTMQEHETFSAGEWAAAWLSAGIWPDAYDPLLERMSSADLDAHFERFAAAIARDVAALPDYPARQ